MENEAFIIKAKQLHTTSSSSIIAWLSLNEEDFNEETNTNKCLVWIGFQDEIEALYNELNKDSTLLSTKYIDEFREINKETMESIYHLVPRNQAQTMFWAVENFICSIVVKLEK